MEFCVQFDEMISALIDGALDEGQEAELRAHMETCPSCKNLYEAFSGLSQAITGELVAPPESLIQGIMFKISIEEQKKGKRRSRIGGFTAAAACVALILVGASRSGLLNNFDLGMGKSAAPRTAAETGDVYRVPENEQQLYQPEQPAANKEQPDARQPASTEPASEPLELYGNEDEEIAFVQFGFAIPNLSNSQEVAISSESREPAFLFDAQELRLYAGKFFSTETATEKNKLLFTVSTEEDLAAVYALATAMPDRAVAYSLEDAAILKADPVYTIFVPANTTVNKNAKDRLISIWFVEKSAWCVVSDVSAAEGQGTETEKIIYKAEGVLSKFEELVARFRPAS